MPKILLIGGSRDGEWIEDPGLPFYHTLTKLWEPICYSTYPAKYAEPVTETYQRIPFRFREGQELDVYAIEGSEGYQVFDLLLRHYNPKPPAAEPPKPQPQPMDLNVERRKAEDKLAAAAWNSFMSQPIPKQK